MRVVTANPNATQAITDACLALARAAASPGTDVVGWTNREGPAVVDSFYGDYSAGRPLARGLRALIPPPDAIVLAGFGNYGTAAVKEALDIPVVSMAEAAMALAVPLCHRFAIVTTAPRMIAYTQDLVEALGFASRCAAVRAVALPPLDGPQLSDAQVAADVAAEVERLQGDTGADLVILGGARLSPCAVALRRRTPVPILEPVACGVHVAEALVRLGLRQSKAGKYATPPLPWEAYGA
jgi:allantoin racemase